jgi:xanthine dehydrogenase small subunit
MRVKELQQITDTAQSVEIGAAVTYSEAFATLSKLHPDLGELLRRLGALQVRNTGTIGGNIANGSPIGDTMPALIALGATLVLRKGASQRHIPLESYFVAYGKQDRAPGEFVEKVILPKLPTNAFFRTYKLSKRFDQDISAVCAALRVDRDGNTVTGARICFGGMAETPNRARHAETALIGKPWSETSIQSAMGALDQDFTPISDMRASARYRLTAAKNLLYRAYLESFENAPQTRVLEIEAAHA